MPLDSLSARANAFSIASIMAAGEGGMLDPALMASMSGFGCVPQQRSTDCYFDWGQNQSYMPGIKGMEGKTLVFFKLSYSALRLSFNIQ